MRDLVARQEVIDRAFGERTTLMSIRRDAVGASARSPSIADDFGFLKDAEPRSTDLRFRIDGSPWGSETPNRSCGEAVVLVDEPIEQVAPPDIARVGRDRLPGRCER